MRSTGLFVARRSHEQVKGRDVAAFARAMQCTAQAPLLYESAPKHMPTLAQMYLMYVYINASRVIRNHIKAICGLFAACCNGVREIAGNIGLAGPLHDDYVKLPRAG